MGTLRPFNLVTCSLNSAIRNALRYRECDSISRFPFWTSIPWSGQTCYADDSIVWLAGHSVPDLFLGDFGYFLYLLTPRRHPFVSPQVDPPPLCPSCSGHRGGSTYRICLYTLWGHPSLNSAVRWPTTVGRLPTHRFTRDPHSDLSIYIFRNLFSPLPYHCLLWVLLSIFSFAT